MQIKNAKSGEEIAEFEQACDKIADFFCRKYFGKHYQTYHWIAFEIGGVLEINEMFFDLNDMLDFMRNS